MNLDELLDRPLDDYLDLPLSEQYPGLRPGVARFDAPGGTLVHAAVRDAIAAYMGSWRVANDHGGFPASDVSDGIAAWVREELRALVGGEGGHVVLGPNMTTLTCAFTRSVGAHLRSGDEIVCTELDHEANVRPWHAAVVASGARVVTVPVREDGSLPAEDVTARITPRTKWVAISAASNVLGTAPDLHIVSRAARAVGAKVFVDGVQAIAHRRVDVRSWNVDALVTSAYKWYGPHCGALWIDEEVASELSLAEQPESAGTELPGRLELGTSDFESMLGTGVAARILLRRDGSAVAAREWWLSELLIDGLQRAGAHVLGPDPKDRVAPVVAFRWPGVPAAKASRMLAEAGSWVWHGTFYAPTLLSSLAVGEEIEAIRCGIAEYTTEEDVRSFLKALRSLPTSVSQR
ncbi:MAG TPA: aminotransferase class V-fold PLP-dependent enzyme [Candidatus Nocardiopsis merdipullorum]|nr:aminotransferase class V-fold PLP-dependent enzyme [Candidatus Nocardiopsis merdipullorum]